MSQLDAVSRILGNLESHAKTSAKNIYLISNNVEKLNEKINQNTVICADISAKLKLIEEQLSSDITPQISDYKKIKQRVIGALVVVSFFSGFVGAVSTATLFSDVATASKTLVDED